MPFQAGRCQCCGYYDYLECVPVRSMDGESFCIWVCRYCRVTLMDGVVLELPDGVKVVAEFFFG